MSTSLSWLLLLYQLPAQPSTQRVQVWRRLRSCAAVNLQHSVWLLPDAPAQRELLSELCRDIESGAGSARLLPIQLNDPERDEEMKELFRKQSQQAYAELIQGCRELALRVGDVSAAGPCSASALAEHEDALSKLEGRLAKMHAYDFFGGGDHGQALDVLLVCHRALDTARARAPSETHAHGADDAASKSVRRARGPR